MTIEFMFNSIKDISMIYRNCENYEDLRCFNNNAIEYLGTDYFNEIISKMISEFSDIKEYKYNGWVRGIAREDYFIETMENNYIIAFNIDTFEGKNQVQLTVNIHALNEINEYDIFLEKMKIFIKNLLLKDWNMCTWICDEQSEHLGMKLYPLIFKVENKMRAFVNKVMTYTLGLKWMERFEFNKVKRSDPKEFKGCVPEFNNINDFLICSTAESLTYLFMKSQIYEPSFVLTANESLILHRMLVEKNHNTIYDILCKSRKTNINIWEDVFKKYFDEEIQTSINDFIKNRNHVAHNKLLTNASYDKMKKNIQAVESFFEKAENAFLIDKPSVEWHLTWSVEQEEIKDRIKYMYDRIKNETGIEILFANEIFNLFEDKINELYTTIYELEYFSSIVTVTSLSKIRNNSEKQVMFSIKSNADDIFSVSIYALLDISDEMDRNSYLKIWAENKYNQSIIKSKIIYHNGGAYEDPIDRCYVSYSESFLDDKPLQIFIKELQKYIITDMNNIKSKGDF